MSIFHLIYTNFFVPCSLQFNWAYHFKLALSVPRLQHDVVTCDGLSWSKKPSLVSLHECRPILRKLTSVHLEFDHHLVPRLTDKLKQRKWATQPIKYITICTEISCLKLCPRGGGVYRYVPPQRVWFLSRFGLKTGIDFEHFGLKLGMVIGGTFTKAYNLIFLPSDRGE